MQDADGHLHDLLRGIVDAAQEALTPGPLDELAVERLVRAMTEGDDLMLVMHGHVSIEREIENYIAVSVADSAALKPMKLDYANKVMLAIALGLPKELKAPLSALGKIRNSFAHNHELDVTEQHARAIYDNLSSTSKSRVNELCREGPRTSAFSSTNPRDGFAICVGHIFASLWIWTDTARRRAILRDEILKRVVALLRQAGRNVRDT